MICSNECIFFFCVFAEPSHFTCVTCKTTCSSAWSLLQHVQNTHGIKIYMDSNSNLPVPPLKPVVAVTTTTTITTPTTTAQLLSPVPTKKERHDPDERQMIEKQNERRHMEELEKERLEERERLERELERRRKEVVEQLHRPKRPGPHTTPPTSIVEVLPHVPPPFLFRMPGMGEHKPLSPATLNPAHFNRPPGEFRIDFDPYHASRMQALGLLHPAMEHPPPPPFQNPFDRMRPPPPQAPAIEAVSPNHIDFYSQRLRFLAGASTSPSHSPSPNRKQQQTPPGYLHNPPSAFTPTSGGSSSSSQPPTSQSLPLEASPAKVTTPPAIPPKLKACEFCGKCFRFQSNLIVHRRSHTGEKPFKCALCPHACTQASKLKRHMKTHMLKAGMTGSGLSGMSDNSTSETSGTPDSSKQGKMDDLDMDVDDLDEDEEDELDDDEEEEEMDLSEVEPGLMNMADMEQPTDLSQANNRLSSSSRAESEKAKMSKENEEPTDLSLPPAPSSNKKDKRTSLLSEVMENTGLNDIEHYSEAYRAALAESSRRNEEAKSENGEKHSENGYKEDGATPKSNTSHDSSSYEASNESNSKRIKMEPAEHHIMSEPMYQTWYPPNPAFLGATALTAEQLCYNPEVHHQNGLSIHESALKIESPNAGPSLNPLSMNSSMLGQHHKREKLRNDTCEFCGKVFRNCSNLTVHRRSHTGEKPYKCSMCSYACAQSSKLTRHMKTHGRVGKDSYLCKFCNTPFTVPSTLEKHMRKCVENQHAMKGLAETESEDTCSSTTASVV